MLDGYRMPRVFRRLGGLGVAFGATTEHLQRDGVTAFASAYERVLAALERKRPSMLVENRSGTGSLSSRRA